MKILCICERGNSRSVALAYIFKDWLGQDALAMGIRAAGADTRSLLFDWAEVIVLVDQRLERDIPDEHRHKLKIWDVGPDRYFGGFHPDLLGQYEQYIRENMEIYERPIMA